MSTLFRDILYLNSMKNPKEIYGQLGFNKKILKISVIDCPFDEADLINGCIIKSGDLFISNLFAVKNDIEKVLNLVKFLNNQHSSGLIIVNQYFKSIPLELKNLAENISFPIILLDESVIYGDIIEEISELIFANKQILNNENVIEKIMKANDNEDTTKYVYTLNHAFMNNFVVYHFETLHQQRLTNIKILFNHYPHSITDIFKYENGYFLFFTFNQLDEIVVEQYNSYFFQTINNNFETNFIGYCPPKNSLGMIKNAMVEAITASTIAKIKNIPLLNYNDLGIYHLIVSAENTGNINNFIDPIINPLLHFDLLKKADLYKTAYEFVFSGGNYEVVSNQMHLHVNSVRNRISKIRQILGYDEKNNDFFVELSLAIISNEYLKAKF